MAQQRQIYAETESNASLLAIPSRVIAHLPEHVESRGDSVFKTDSFQIFRYGLFKPHIQGVADNGVAY